MNDLHKDQLKLSYQQSYTNSNTGIINIEELKRANSRLSKKNPQRTSGSLLAYMVKNRKAAYEDNKDELLDYDDFEQRVDSFIRQNQKHDQTSAELVFDILDSDKDGVLNVEDLMKFLASVGSQMEQKQVVDLLELMTAEGTSLGRKEFQLIFQHL